VTVNAGAIPSELRERAQWVIWRGEMRDGKRTKVPYRADGDGRASSTDPATWATFDTALAASETLNADGVGYVFSTDDPYFGVDLDDSLSAEDRYAIMHALDTYTEESVSGAGYHVIGRGQLNGHGRHPHGLGVFDQDRYFVFTGEHVPDTPATIEDRQAELEQVLGLYLPTPAPAAAPTRPPQPVNLDDRGLLEKAFAARNGADFRALWEGRWQGTYSSQSEADLALCATLAFWTDRDPDRIDQMFRQSGLHREKWERADYRTRTIETAIAGTPDGYTPATNGDHDPGPDPTKPPLDEPVIGVMWQRLSEIAMRSIVFLDKPLLQASAFHLVAGRKGMGKGTWLADVAARVNRGELGPKRNVVWIGSEDSNSIDVRPRVEAAGGDPERILIVKQGWIQLPRDVDEIRHAMHEFGDVGMLAIDPVGNHIAGKDSNSDTDIRDAIAPLNPIADEHECMVFGVRHLSEKECKNGVLAAIVGTSAWVQVPRAVLAIVRDNEDPKISHVQCISGNRLPPETPGRMFRIEGVLLPELENEVTRAVRLGDSNKDIGTMLAGTREKEPSKSAAARELILDILETEGDKESDGFDARIANETGITAKTVRNIRGQLSDAGLIGARPDKNDDGLVLQWQIYRTLAPRGDHT
jgi:hypothetical protein